MKNSVLEIALNFGLITIYGLVFSALLAAFSAVICRCFNWCKQWREYWCVMLLVSVAFIFIGLLPLKPVISNPLFLHDLNLTTAHNNFPVTDIISSIPANNEINWQENLALGWLFVYAIFTAFYLFRFSTRIRTTSKLISASRSIEKCDGSINPNRIALLRKLAKRLAINIAITKENVSPFIIQWPKTYLIVSTQALENLSEAEFTLMLRHELQHLKHQDGRLNPLIELTICFFWFNPVMKYFVRQLQWAMELGCDNAVLSRYPNLRRTYAQAMLKVLRGSATQDANQMVAAFSSTPHRRITMRIQHIMNPSVNRIKASVKNAGLLSFAMCTTALAFAFQPAVNAKPHLDTSSLLHPLPNARLTATFGVKNKIHKFHKGIDLAAKMNTPVIATAAGTVITATEKLAGFEGYGTVLVIDHGDGLKSIYAHLNTLDVYEGDYVKTGQLVGRVGNTGRSTGPHLHFELLQHGERVNPLNYIN